MRNLKCVCCKSEKIDKKGIRGDFTVYKCGNCDLEFVHPLPDTKDLNNFYVKKDFSDLKNIIKMELLKFENNKLPHKKKWLKKIIEIGKEHTNNSKMEILEIGSGAGFFIHLSNNMKHHAIGFESSKEFSELISQEINGEIFYTEDYKYNRYLKPESLDLIYLEHVFEHILKPTDILNNLIPLLKKEGIIIMVIPNHNSFLAKIFGLKWDWVTPPDHLFYYNKNAISALFERLDLKIIKSWSYDFYFRSIPQFYSLEKIKNFITRFFNRFLGMHFTIKHSYNYYFGLKGVINYLPYWILYPVIKIFQKFGMGSELIIIAKKKSI